MKLSITLTDGETLRVDVRVSPADWNRRYRRAVRRGGLLEVENARGRVLGINPKLIKYVQYEREASASSQPETVPLRLYGAGGPSALTTRSTLHSG